MYLIRNNVEYRIAYKGGNDMDGKNYMENSTRSLMYNYFCFVDTNEYFADRIFKQHKINVKLGDEYGRDDSKYVIIFCRVKKKEREEFETAMKELEQKMLILGHKDYMEFCGRLQVREKGKG